LLQALLFLATIVLCVYSAAAPQSTMGPAQRAGPHPPCDGAVDPPYPDLNQAVANKSWSAADLGRSWEPPSCLEWNSIGFTTLVTTVGKFRYPNDGTGFLRAFAAVSEWKGLCYWSVSHKRWRTLIIESHALTAAQGQRRPDFQADEMKEGNELYFEQDNNLTGKARYRMQILKATQDHVAVKIENVGPIRYLLMPVLHSGDLQSIYFLDRESDHVWRYYSMTRTGNGANRLIAGNDSSSFNRAVAVYRHLAGIPDNTEPPAAAQ
jgi:hypothetical protein